MNDDISAGAAEATERRRLKTVCAVDVETKPVRWVWKYRIARDMLNGVGGHGGTAKTTAMLDVLSRVTTGQPMPGEDEALLPPTDVLIVSAEDTAERVLVPRLKQAGADLSRVHIVPMSELPSFPDDTTALEKTIQHHSAAMVLVDPWSAMLSGGINSHRDSDLRRALSPLAGAAERTGAAVVLIAHLNKDQSHIPLHRLSGSVGFGAAMRMALLAAEHPDEPGTFVLAQLKANIAPPVPAWTYTLKTDPSGEVTYVAWGKQLDIDTVALVAPRNPEKRLAIDDAADFLDEALRDGEREAAALREEAEAEGLAWRTVRRASERRRVQHSKRGVGAEGKWYWSLPEDPGAKGGQPPDVAVLEGRGRKTAQKYATSPKVANSDNLAALAADAAAPQGGQPRDVGHLSKRPISTPPSGGPDSKGGQPGLLDTLAPEEPAAFHYEGEV